MQYLQYKGAYYDVGTKVKIKTWWNGVQEAVFCGWGTYPFRGIGTANSTYHSWNTEEYIVEIVEPVYPSQLSLPVSSHQYPSPGAIDIGWAWYILIMLVGMFFEGRWLIWIFATIYFFLWKNGFFNGGTK